MYRILVGNDVLFDPEQLGAKPVAEAKMSEQLNEAGSLKFALSYGHPMYGLLDPLSTFVTAYDDDEVLFYGRLLDAGKPSFSGQVNYECEGALSFLMDSEVTPSKNAYQKTPEEFFQWCIDQHNADIGNDSRRTFTAGTVTIDERATPTAFSVTSYTQTKTVIENQLVNVYGGMLRVRYSNGVRYLDWIKEYPNRLNPQTIQIGVNVMERSFTSSGENLYTVLRPTGKNGLLLDTPTIDLFPQETMTTYGRIVKTVSFADADTKAKLQTRTQEYVSRLHAALLCSGEIKMVDMHYLDGTSPKVRLGDRFNNIEGLVGEELTVSSLERDFFAPYEDTLTLNNPKGMGDGNGRNSISKMTGRNSSSSGMAYKYIKETEDTLAIIAPQVEMHGETLDQHYERIEQTANNYTRLSTSVNEIAGNVETITGSGVIQNDELLTQFAGTMRLIRDQEGNVTRIEFVDGTMVMDHDENGHMVTVGSLVEQSLSETGGLREEITGSALWTQRDNITGVTGEYDIETDPVTGAKTLVIKSGGGIKIRRDNTEFGLYDSGNLTGGIIASKLNDGTVVTKISGDVVNITASQMASIGIYTEDHFDAGFIVERLSDGVTTGKISASYLDLSGIEVTVGAEELVQFGLIDPTTHQLTAGIILEKLSDGQTQGKISANYLDLSGIEVTVGAEELAQYGLIDPATNTLTAGLIVQKLNAAGETLTKISGDIIELSTNDNFSQLVLDTTGLAGRIGNAETSIHELQVTSEGFESTVRGLDGTVSYLENTVNGMASVVTELDGNVSSLINDVDGMTSIISNVDGRVSTLQNGIDGLSSEVRTQDGRISVLENTADGLESTVRAADERVSSFSNTIEGIESRVGNAEGQLSVFENTVNGLHERVENQYGDITNLWVTATGLQQVTRDAENNIGILQSTATQFESRLSTAEGNVSSLQNDANGMRSTVDNINTRVYDAETNITHMTGSALWNQRDAITGVVGEFDVAEDAQGNKKLIIKSGGGLLIERDGVQYGLYDQGNLTAGLLINKLNNGQTSAKLKADRISLEGEDGISLNEVFTVNQGHVVANVDMYAMPGSKFDGDFYGSFYYSTQEQGHSVAHGLLKKAEVDGDTLKIWKFGDADNSPSITFKKASLVRGSWSGTIYTVSADSTGTKLPLSSSIIMQVEGTPNPSATVSVNLYHDSPERTNMIDSGTLNLVELSGQKKVELRLTVGNTYLTKGSISTAATYNAGWDYGLTQYTVSMPEPSAYEGNTKTLSFGERYKILYTFKKSDGTTFESKQVIKAPDQPDPVYVIPEINGPSWSLYGNNAGDTNTVSASATGATTKYSYTKLIMGTAFNASTHIGQVQLKASTVSSADAGTNGTIVGRFNVDASSVWTQGNDAVTLSDTVTFTEALSSDPKYSYNTAKVSTTGRSSGNLEKIVPLYLKEGGWSDKKEYVYLYYASPSDNTKRMAKIEVDGSGIYKNGWDAARAKISLPSANTSSNSISIGIPPETVDGAAVTKQYAIAQTANDPDRVDLVNSENGTNTIVARWRHGQYTIGYGVGWNAVDFQSIGIKSGSALPGNDEADTSSYDDVKTKIIEAVLKNGKSDTLNLKYRWAKYSPQSGVQHNCVNIAVGKGGTTDTRVGRIDIEQLYEDGKTAGKSLANVTVAWEQSNPQSSANPYNKLVIYREGTALASLNQVISTDITYDSSTHKYTATTTSSGKSGSVITATSNDQAYKDGYNAVSISIGMSSSDDPLIGTSNNAENTGTNDYDRVVTRHIVAQGTPGTASATMQLKYAATTYKTASNETHECVNISTQVGSVSTRVGRIDVHPVYTNGYNKGSPSSATLGSRTTGTVYNLSVKKKDNSYAYLTVDCADPYNYGFDSVPVPTVRTATTSGGAQMSGVGTTPDIDSSNPSATIRKYIIAKISDKKDSSLTAAEKLREKNVELAFRRLTFTPSNGSGTHNGVAIAVGGTRVGLVDVQPVYNSGWENARADLSLPAQADTKTYLRIGYPNGTPDEAQLEKFYYLGSHATNKNVAILYTKVGSSDVTVAQYTHGKYDAGWRAAYAKVKLPGAAGSSAITTTNTLNIETPAYEVDAAKVVTQYTMINTSGDNDRVDLVSASGITVARWRHGQYTAGRTYGQGEVQITIGMSGDDPTPVGNDNIAENTASGEYNKKITRHVVADGNPGTAYKSMRLEYAATTYQTANDGTHECVNISVGQGTVNTRIGRLDVHPVYTNGYNAANPKNVTLGSRTTGTVYNVSVTRGNNTTAGFTLDCAAPYNYGFDAVTVPAIRTSTTSDGAQMDGVGNTPTNKDDKDNAPGTFTRYIIAKISDKKDGSVREKHVQLTFRRLSFTPTGGSSPHHGVAIAVNNVRVGLIDVQAVYNFGWDASKTLYIGDTNFAAVASTVNLTSNQSLEVWPYMVKSDGSSHLWGSKVTFKAPNCSPSEYKLVYSESPSTYHLKAKVAGTWYESGNFWATEAYNNGWYEGYDTNHSLETSAANGNGGYDAVTSKTITNGATLELWPRFLQSDGKTYQYGPKMTVKASSAITPSSATAMGSIDKTNASASNFISNCIRLKASSSSNVCSTGKYYKFTVKCGTAQRTYYFET